MPQSQYIDLASGGNIGLFYQKVEEALSDSWVSNVAWMNDASSQATETYVWVGAPPRFREWIGGRAGVRPSLNKFSIKNKVFEQTLELSVDDLRQDKTSQIQALIASMAVSTAGLWSDLTTGLINSGAATACYDGEYFFDTDHPMSTSTSSATTGTNNVTASECPSLNVATATAPTPDEAAKSILEIIGHFQTFTDDQGNRVNANARQFMFMAGTVPIYAALLQATTALNLTSGASNPVMGLKSNGINASVVLNPSLSSATQLIYAFRTDAILKPFIIQIADGIKTSVQGAGSYEEFHNRRHCFGTTIVGNAGYGLWQYALKATLS